MNIDIIITYIKYTSKCHPEFVPSANKFVKNARQRVLDAKIIEMQNNVYVFVKDYLFPSPSQAASTVLGRSTNGWTMWKDSKGRTLDELKRK